MNSRQVFGGFAAGLGALALVACGGEADAPVEEIAEGDCPPGVTVSEGWLAMPAVGGNPAAVYFTIANDGERRINIRSASVIGSESTMLHETTEYDFEMQMHELTAVNLEPGEEMEFEPGGRHVMVFGLSEEMEAGSENEVTLTFAGGDKCSFPVTYYPAGTDPREAGDEEA